MGLLYVSGKPPTYPSPKPTNINTYFSLRAKYWLRGGVGGQFPDASVLSHTNGLVARPWVSDGRDDV